MGSGFSTYIFKRQGKKGIPFHYIVKQCNASLVTWFNWSEKHQLALCYSYYSSCQDSQFKSNGFMSQRHSPLAHELMGEKVQIKWSLPEFLLRQIELHVFIFLVLLIQPCKYCLRCLIAWLLHKRLNILL